jgi:hypothetical protein
MRMLTKLSHDIALFCQPRAMCVAAARECTPHHLAFNKIAAAPAFFLSRNLLSIFRQFLVFLVSPAPALV